LIVDAHNTTLKILIWGQFMNTYKVVGDSPHYLSYWTDDGVRAVVAFYEGALLNTEQNLAAAFPNKFILVAFDPTGIDIDNLQSKLPIFRKHPQRPAQGR
jgi:hypothetical protein